MDKELFEKKETYQKEEVLEIIRETMFQLGRDLDKELYDLKEKIEEENDPLIRAGMKRKKLQLKDDRRKADKYYSKTGKRFLTECCDADISYYALKTRGQCSECGEDMPETREKEHTLEEYLNHLNQKIERQNKDE